jgi:hypothetical protein
MILNIIQLIISLISNTVKCCNICLAIKKYQVLFFNDQFQYTCKWYRLEHFIV